MLDKKNIYNTIIEHIEEKYDIYISYREKKAFILGYIFALKDTETLNNEEIISLITEMFSLDFI